MSRSVSSGAWTTRPRFSTIVEICPLETGATARSAIPQQRLHLVEDRGGYLVLRRLRDRSLAGWSKERHLVLVRVETDVGSRDVVEDEEVGALVGQLLPRALEAGWAGFGREADEELAVAGAFAQGREDVGRRLELERPRRRVLGPLRRESLRGAVVGDGRGHDDDVGLGGAGERLALELGGGGRLDEIDAGRRRHRQVGREERHLGAAPARLSGERDAHPPRRAVADEADRVERLAGAARRDEDALPAEWARSHEQSTSGAKDLVRLRHPPHPELPLRRLALVRPAPADPARPQSRG